MTIITSVLGFNLDIDLRDHEGNPVKKGAKTGYFNSADPPKVGTEIGGERWFTNFNEPLLNKIRNYKKIND